MGRRRVQQKVKHFGSDCEVEHVTSSSMAPHQMVPSDVSHWRTFSKSAMKTKKTRILLSCPTGSLPYQQKVQNWIIHVA